MQARSVIVSLVTCFVALAWCFGQDAMIGTWKLNKAKSKLGAGGPKNNTVVIEAAGENVKITMDGVDPTGKPTHNEWTGKFDGKEYPVTGDASSDTRSYKKIDDRTFEVSGKKGGKSCDLRPGDGVRRWQNTNSTCEGIESLRRKVRNDRGLRQAISCFKLC